MDTPAMPAPKDAREQDILDRLLAIRDRLLLLKQDRTQYIRSQDVMLLYEQVIEQVKQLNSIRGSATPEENRLDKVLDSCFQLLSLFFMTIGRTSEAPAAYAMTSTIRRLLSHLAEAKLYAASDLDSMSKTLAHLDNVVNDEQAKKSTPYMIKLLCHSVERCKTTIAALQKELDNLGECLLVRREKMISILRSMALANTKSKFSVSEVEKLREQLKEIESKQVDGKFLTSKGDVATGSDEVSDLLARVLKWSEIVLERKGEIPDKWKPMYDILIGIRNKLDKLSITQAWSLRETDLYDFQRQLDKIDEARVDGNWLDEEGKPAELYVQRTCLYLIRRSYGYIYHLMVLSEPVSEALLPIYNQLSTLKRCLIEVKESGGVSSVRELYPYSMKLNSIDNMKVDGKFMVGGDIPEGQAAVTDLLAECFDLNYELRVAAEEAAETEGAVTDQEPETSMSKLEIAA